jgi:hypothetical protein
MSEKGRKLRQWERQEEDRREMELVGKKNKTDSSKERMLERERERERRGGGNIHATLKITAILL